MYIDVPRIVDKSPARDLEPRGRVEERHGGKEQALTDHEAVDCSATSKCAPISQHAALILEYCCSIASPSQSSSSLQSLSRILGMSAIECDQQQQEILSYSAEHKLTLKLQMHSSPEQVERHFFKDISFKGSNILNSWKDLQRRKHIYHGITTKEGRESTFVDV